MSTDEPNSHDGTQDTGQSHDEPGNQGVAMLQGFPASPPSPKDENKPNRPKPYLAIRLWRIHRRRQKKVAPPNVAEKITVFLILVTAFIGGVQAFIYNQQKQIMASSSGQTDQLIEASDTQARAARRIALASRREARAADRNADAAASFSASAKIQATAARDAAEAMADQVGKLQAEVDQTKILATTAQNALAIQTKPLLGFFVDDVKLTQTNKDSHTEQVATFRAHVIYSLRSFGNYPAVDVPLREARGPRA